MRILTIVIGLVAVLAAVLAATPALGQYYVPLRYDLRYTSPTYIPSGNYGYGLTPPPRVDPYAFGSMQYQNLDLTGNVRGGRSFQGNTGITQPGSQLSMRLPSMALSNFNRDSFSIGDIGTGLEWGMTQPYFPGSASVTNIGTAGMRFATPMPGARAPYTLPNLNSALPGYMPAATSGVNTGIVTPRAVPAPVVRAPGGLYVPPGSMEWVNALIEGRIATPGVTGLPGEKERPDMRIGIPKRPVDVRIGIKTGTTAEGAEAGETQAERRQPGEGETGSLTEPFESTQSALYWMVREAAAKDRAKPPEEAAVPLPKPETKGGAFAAPLPGEEEPPLPGMKEKGTQPPAIPPVPEPYRPPETYAAYLNRAETAMRELNFVKAEPVFAAAATMDPSKAAPAFGRINALLGVRRYAHAAILLDQMLRAHPEWANEAPNIRSVYPKPEIYDRIVSDLLADLKNRPGNDESSLTIGYVYFAAGRFEDARLYLNHIAAGRTEGPGPEKAILKAMLGGKK
jgi:hypothetical protein